MGHVLGFNGIRALAALSVVLTHLGIFGIVKDKGWLSETVIQSLHGGAGVQAFFVLSGFLITRILIAEHKKNSGVSLYNFYIRRSLRIFPLYYLVVFMVFFCHVMGEHVANYKSLVFAGIYSYNFIPKNWYSAILGHTWSLAVEEHFYLLWPFIFISFSHNFRKLSWLLLGFVSLSLFLAIFLKQNEWLNNNFFIDRWTFIAGANIALGAALALLLELENTGKKMQGLLRFKSTLLFALLFIFNQVFILNIDSSVSHYVRGLGFAFLIGWIALNQASLLVRILEIKPLDYLGKVSYGIYMYQGFFLSTGPFREIGQTWPPDQITGLMLLVIVVPLSYHFFEVPIMQLKQKFQRPV